MLNCGALSEKAGRARQNPGYGSDRPWREKLKTGRKDWKALSREVGLFL